MSLMPYLVVSIPSTGVLNVCKAKNVLLLVQNEECVCGMRSFDWGTHPPLSTKVDTDIIHMIKWIRPSSSIFVIKKTGWLEGLGMRLC